MTTLTRPLRKEKPILHATREAIAEMAYSVSRYGRCQTCGERQRFDYEHIRTNDCVDLAGRLRYLVWCKHGHKEIC
jgi:predicted nucleic acid-binding Zn ribbon protein